LAQQFNFLIRFADKVIQESLKYQEGGCWIYVSLEDDSKVKMMEKRYQKKLREMRPKKFCSRKSSSKSSKTTSSNTSKNCGSSSQVSSLETFNFLHSSDSENEIENLSFSEEEISQTSLAGIFGANLFLW